MMAHLDHWNPNSNLGFADAEDVRRDVSNYIWHWFELNKETVIAKILFWKVRLKEIEWVFERILGSNPYA